MSQVRHHVIMAQNERILKEEVLRLQLSLDEAKKIAAAKAEGHNKSIDDLKASKAVIEKEVKKENTNAEATRGSADELKQALDVAKVVEKDLGARVDMEEARIKELKAQNKLALDNLAMVEAETKDKINVGRDDLVDLAMYRVWEHNQNTDICFMRGEAEGLLKKWKARLEEERELRYITASKAISEGDEDDNNVISSILKTGSSRPEEIAKETREIFEADKNTSTPAEANPVAEIEGAVQVGDGTKSPAKDANQP